MTNRRIATFCGKHMSCQLNRCAGNDINLRSSDTFVISIVYDIIWWQLPKRGQMYQLRKMLSFEENMLLYVLPSKRYIFVNCKLRPNVALIPN